jgi:hypothetical protein
VSSGTADSLASINLPAAVSIGDYAFQNRDALTSITLPTTLTTVGTQAFRGCTSLTSITVDGGNTSFAASDGMLTDKAGTTLIACPAAAAPNLSTITAIGTYAFADNTNLTSVTLTNAQTVGDYAFSVSSSASNSLTSIALPAATSVGDYAFQYRSALTTLSLPAVTSLSNTVFSGCTGLQTLDLSSVTSIADGSDTYSGYFYGLRSSLQSVDLSAATSIGTYAFADNTNLTSVTLTNAQTIGTYAFRYAGGTALEITLGAPPPTVGESMFYNVSVTKNVTVKRPSSGATAYGTAPNDTSTNNWGNAFRGKGWTSGTNTYDIGTVNGNIDLSITDP